MMGGIPRNRCHRAGRFGGDRPLFTPAQAIAIESYERRQLDATNAGLAASR